MKDMINRTVCIEYKSGSTVFNCAGRIIEDTTDTFTVGFNFYLDEATDLIVLKKEDIVTIKEILL